MTFWVAEVTEAKLRKLKAQTGLSMSELVDRAVAAYQEAGQ